jgi:KDO2-lipid IV(A) lauroyltransferase
LVTASSSVLYPKSINACSFVSDSVVFAAARPACIGAALGWLVYLLSPSHRRRLRSNLELAGYGGHLRAAIAESGKAIVELPFVWCAPQERVTRHVTMENWELVQRQLDAGRGIVFLTPHLGCFELTAQQVSLRQELTVMYRPPRKSALKPLVEGARARQNMHLAPANLSGVRMLVKALRGGQPVGVLPDQVPQEGEGVWAPFFGRDAYTMTLPAKLAQLGKADILLTCTPSACRAAAATPSASSRSKATLSGTPPSRPPASTAPWKS